MSAPGAWRPGILLIGNYPPPFGGVPRHLEDLVPYLARSGWDVHVLSGGTTAGPDDREFKVYRDARGRLTRRLATVGFLGRTAAAGRLAPALAAARRMPLGMWAAVMTRVSLAAAIVERHDIRVVSAYNLLSGAPVGAIVAEMYRIPLVVTNLGEIYSHRSQVTALFPMVRHIADTAAVLTSLTQHCADSYRELGLSPPVRVLHYGIDRRFTTPDGDQRVRRQHGVPPDADLVLFVGRLVRDMGVQVLLEALPRLMAAPGLHVLIAGASGELEQAVRAAAAAHAPRVAVAVDVSEDDLPGLYAAASLVVAPTLGARACGSLAAGEAMAAGKPVVASRVGGIPEYVSDGETGLLVPPGDAGALAAAVLSLVADRARMRELGRRGAERVAALFDGERTNAALDRLFRETAGL